MFLPYEYYLLIGSLIWPLEKVRTIVKIKKKNHGSEYTVAGRKGKRKKMKEILHLRVKKFKYV